MVKSSDLDLPIRYHEEPWKMLIACVLLDRATKEDVERVMDDVFLEYPTPDHLATARVHELASMLHPLGIHTRRAQLLIHLAEQWCEITHG